MPGRQICRTAAALAAICIALLLPASPARAADVVVLTSGEQFEGTVVGRDDANVIVRLPSGATRKLPRAAIYTIVPDARGWCAAPEKAAKPEAEGGGGTPAPGTGAAGPAGARPEGGSGGDGLRKCPTCNGLGKTRCPDCPPCPECAAQGSAACAECGGAAQASCARCNGTGMLEWKEPVIGVAGGGGHVVKRARCGKCKGSGSARCERCAGAGTKRCAACKGAGVAAGCTSCAGKRTLACGRCSGSGKVPESALRGRSLAEVLHEIFDDERLTSVQKEALAKRAFGERVEAAFAVDDVQPGTNESLCVVGTYAQAKVYVTFGARERARLAALSRGTRVTVRGTVRELRSDAAMVDGEELVVESAPPAGAPPAPPPRPAPRHDADED